MKCWRTLGKQCAVIALWIALWALLAAGLALTRQNPRNLD